MLRPSPAEYLVLIVVGIATFTDLRTRTIPNLLTMGAGAIGLARLFADGWARGGPGAGIGSGAAGLVGALLVSLFPAVMFFRGELGGGDVKLFAVIGVWCGGRMGLQIELVSFVIFAVAFTIVTGARKWMARRQPASGDKALTKPARWPFAPYILAGYVASTFSTLF